MAPEKKFVSSKLNKFMHPRNPYRTPPSFKKLSMKFPEFRAYCTYDVSGKVHLDFKNPRAVRALTTSLLDQDFDLKVSIPDDRLVPTLPLRLNYLLWIEDLLTHAAHYDSEHFVLAIDIGVGAACVYPLLGAKRFGWCFVGTESDQLSFTSAHTNVQNNNLQDKIFLKKVESNIIFKDVIGEEKVKSWTLECKLRSKVDIAECSKKCAECEPQASQLNPQNEVNFDEGQVKAEIKKTEECSTYLYDFTMCNPPFFSCEEETDTMKKSKKDRGEPLSAPTGAIHEKVTEGGEISFITKMIEESQLFKDKIRIFTTLIGTKAHIKLIKNALSTASPSCSVLTEFCQGRTMRWGVAWTFDPSLKLNQVKSKKDMATNKPLILMMPRSLMSVYSVPSAWNMINKWLHHLKVKVQVLKSSKYFISVNVKAFKATWLHQRRKERQNMRRGVGASNGNMNIDGNNSEIIENGNGRSSKRKREAGGETCGDHDGEMMMKVNICTDRDFKTNRCSEAIPKNQSSLDCSLTSSHLGSPHSISVKEIPQNHSKQENLKLTQGKDKLQNLNKGKQERLESILRCNLQVKQSGALISLEAFYLGGSSGKDGLNQLLQFMRNQLTKPTV